MSYAMGDFIFIHLGLCASCTVHVQYIYMYMYVHSSIESTLCHNEDYQRHAQSLLVISQKRVLNSLVQHLTAFLVSIPHSILRGKN